MEKREHVPFENNPDSSFVLIGGFQRYSPSAKIARAVVAHMKKNWKFWVMALIGLAGAVIELLSLIRGQKP